MRGSGVDTELAMPLTLSTWASCDPCNCSHQLKSLPLPSLKKKETIEIAVKTVEPLRAAARVVFALLRCILDRPQLFCRAVT